MAIVSTGKIVTKTAKHVIRIYEPNRKMPAKIDVDTTTDCERKRIVAGRLIAANAFFVAGVSIEIGMGTAHQNFGKGFELSCASL